MRAVLVLAVACGSSPRPAAAPSAPTDLTIHCAPARPLPFARAPIRADATTRPRLGRIVVSPPYAEADLVQLRITHVLDRLASCVRDEDITGTYDLVFELPASGRPTHLAVAGPDDRIRACWTQVIESLELPVPPATATVRVPISIGDYGETVEGGDYSDRIVTGPDGDPWLPYATRAGNATGVAEVERVLRARAGKLDACFRGPATARMMVTQRMTPIVGGSGSRDTDRCLASVAGKLPGVGLACDVTRGTAPGWRVVPEAYVELAVGRDAPDHWDAIRDRYAHTSHGAPLLVTVAHDAPAPAVADAIAHIDTHAVIVATPDHRVLAAFGTAPPVDPIRRLELTADGVVPCGAPCDDCAVALAAAPGTTGAQLTAALDGLAGQGVQLVSSCKVGPTLDPM